MYSVFYELFPKVVSASFCSAKLVHGHWTRNQSKFYHNLAISNARKFSISIAGPILWDTIPQDIKDARTIINFNLKYKQFLLEQYSHP